MAKVKINGPMPQFECEIWWRADDRRYANYDPFAEFDQPSGSHCVIELTPYEVIKHTPKGVWVRRFMGRQQFVLGSAIRQECVPTKEIALKDLIERKRKHVKMSQNRLDRAQQHLRLAENALLQLETSAPE